MFKFSGNQCSRSAFIFLRIRIQLFFSMRNRDPALKNFLMKSFLGLKTIEKATHKCQTMKLVQIYLFFLYKITITVLYFLFSWIFSVFSSNFFSWVRMQEGKLMRIHADPDPQPWWKLYILSNFSKFQMRSTKEDLTHTVYEKHIDGGN